MRESVVAFTSASTEKRGSRLPQGAMDCTTKFARAARGIWPVKTAFHWAAAAGVKERMAKYWLAATSESEVSDAGRLALIRELN